MIKLLLKKVLKSFNLKLIKLSVKKLKKHPFPSPSPKEINLIRNAKGILHIGGHRGTEAAVYDWFNKPVVWVEAAAPAPDRLLYSAKIEAPPPID